MRVLCGCCAGAVRVLCGCRAGAMRVQCGCRAGAVRVPCGCRAGAVREPCDGVRLIASVHNKDDPVGHDVQVVSGVVGE